jgi:hypothetical protein
MFRRKARFQAGFSFGENHSWLIQLARSSLGPRASRPHFLFLAHSASNQCAESAECNSPGQRPGQGQPRPFADPRWVGVSDLSFIKAERGRMIQGRRPLAILLRAFSALIGRAAREK